MRVTKLIREHVERTVGSIYAPVIQKIKEQKEAEMKELDIKIQAILEKANDEARKLVSEEYPSFMFIDRWNNERCAFQDCHNIQCTAYKDEINTLLTRRDHAIENILLNLELGAGKNELDTMLAAVKVED